MRPTSTTSTATRKALRLSDAEVTRILDALDSHAHDPSRHREQYPYRQPALRVRFEGVGEECLVAPSRWINRTSLGLLWGRFVHQNVSCLVQLVTTHGTWNDIRAVVSSCRYVAPHVYEIELNLAHPVDPSLYCKGAGGGMHVLLVDDQPLLAKLAMHQLRELHATAEYCGDPDQASDLLTSGRFDVVLIDINMPKQSGDELLRVLRQKGYAGRAVAFTASADDDAARARLLALGFDDVLAKPFTRAELERVLAASRAEAIVSSLADDPAIGPLIDGFVTQFHEWVRELQQALASGALARICDIAREIRAQGSVFGFDAISAAGARLETVAAGSEGAEALAAAVTRLTELARLVRGPETPGSSGAHHL